MGIGLYRHLVTFDDPAGALDPPTWHCQIQPAIAQVVEGQAGYFLRGRYHPGIRLETRIVFEGRSLQVQSITDVDERHQDVVISAVEVVARGQ